MATIAQKLSSKDFAAKIKAKYPDYASIPDDELTQKMLDKFPEYRDTVEVSPQSPFPVAPVPESLRLGMKPVEGQVEGFFREGLVEPVTGLLNLVKQKTKEFRGVPHFSVPAMAFDIGKGLVNAQAEAGQEWLSRGMEGQGVGGRLMGDVGNVGRFLEAGIPVLGPAARRIRKQLEGGEAGRATAGTIGLLAGTGATAAVKEGALTLVPRAMKQKAFRQAVDALPDTLMKALKPSIAIRKQFSEVAPAALDDVVSFAKTSGNNLESMADIAKVNHGVRQTILEDMKKLTSRGVSLDGDAIAAQLRKFRESYNTQLIDKTTGKPVSVTQPGVSAADFSEIDNAISMFEGKMVPLEVAENMRRGVNARLSSFMRKNDIRKGQELKSNPGTAGNSALIDVLAEQTDAALSKVKSPGMTQLRKRYSNNRVLDDAVTERIIREMTAEEVGLLDFQSLDTITFGSAFTAAALGNLPAAATLGLTGGARRVIDVIGHRMRQPDKVISKAFKDVRGSEFVKPFKRVTAPERKLLTGRTDLQGPFQQGAAPPDSPAFGSGAVEGGLPPAFGSVPMRLLPAAGQTGGPRTVIPRSQFPLEITSGAPAPQIPREGLLLSAGKPAQASTPSSTAFRKGPADIGPDAPLEARLDQMLGLNRPPNPANVRVIGGQIEVWTGKKWKAMAKLE